MENAGWIKLHRCLLRKAAWQLCTEGQKVVLITVLLLANHEQKNWLWEGKKYECGAGQFITSYAKLAKTCGVNVQTVRSALKKLQTLEFLKCTPTHSGTLISVVNWEIYQNSNMELTRETAHRPTQLGSPKNVENTGFFDSEDEEPTRQSTYEAHKTQHRANTEPTQSQHATQQLTRSKEVKNEKNKRNIYGEYKHVRLTKDEYERLASDFGQIVTDNAIKVVDEYCEQSGKTYKNYNLAIRKWGIERARKDSGYAVGSGADDTAQRDYEDWISRQLNGRSIKSSENDVFQ